MIQLDVLIPPRIELSMTINSRHLPITNMINNGENVRVTCATWGHPRPSISWFKNGVLHIESRRHQHKNQNISREFAAEDLYIGGIILSDMVRSICHFIPKGNRYKYNNNLCMSRSCIHILWHYGIRFFLNYFIKIRKYSPLSSS